jgi:hypothetical protein
MALEELVHRVGEGINRRKFLARAGVAVLGTTYTIMGLPQPAYATHLYCYKCCCLCHAPTSGSCCGGATPYCIWSWNCCGSAGNRWRCSEYYCGGGSCDSNCTGVNCSKAVKIGSCGTLNKCNFHCGN